MIYAAVQTALDTQLQTVTGLPTFTAENTLYNNKGKANTAFCRATLLPAEAVPATVGITGKNEYFGLYQIDLFYPLHAGKATVNAMVDSVVSAFARESLTVGSSQMECRAAWAEAGRIDEQHYLVPVVVRWRIRA